MTMISAVVLAAGQSRRIGTQKLLLPFAGQTVIGHVVDQVLAAFIGQVLVVVPEEGKAIRLALAGRRVTFAINPDSAGDMLSSVRCGLRVLPERCRAVLIVLGDQPAISADLICDLVRAFETSARRIVVPVHNGRRGHPILFSADYVAELLTLHDGAGLRGLLQAHPDDIHPLDVTNPAVLADIDHLDDYNRELARFREAKRQ
jgi:molybdenum cofactor cytidylyltransferase